jgi:thiamine biosynthesis lipoprotein ApbE
MVSLDRPLLTQGETEQMILQICDEIEQQTYLYAEQSEVSAIAEADYKIARSRSYVMLSERHPKMTASEREMRADLSSADHIRQWKLHEARRQATRESLLSLRARLDALRSISANIRHQT